MQYSLRWWYAAGIILLLSLTGFIWDWYPGLKHLHDLRAQETQATAERLSLQEKALRKKVRIAGQNRRLASELNRIHVLMKLVHDSGVVLQQVKLLDDPLGKYSRLRIHLSILGTFSVLNAFLAALHGLQILVVIENFTWQYNGADELQLALDILSPAAISNDSGGKFLAFAVSGVRDPFCAAQQTPIPGSSQLHASLSVPLAQIRMTGFMKHGARIMAIVAMPENKVIVIEPGVILGKEHGKVSTITRDHVVVRLPQGRQFIVKMF